MWPFKRRPDPEADKSGSKAALRSAQSSLRTITDRHDEVLKVSSDLRKMRGDNHFSEHLMRLIEEGRK